MLQQESWDQRLLPNLRCLSSDDHTYLAENIMKYKTYCMHGELALSSNIFIVELLY